jgi:outer membrane protein W
MKFRVVVLLVIAATAVSASAADSKWSIYVGPQWIWKTGQNRPEELATGRILDANLRAGGGVAVGLAYWFSDRVSFEVSSGGARLSGVAKIQNGDMASAVKLGHIGVYPFNGVLQYHFLPNHNFSPYVGAGASYIRFGSFENPPEGLNLRDDFGFLTNAGIEWSLSKHLDLVGDAKYAPFETGAGFASGHRGLRFKPVFGTAGLRYRF